MNSFEIWWKQTDYTEMDGPVPHKVAKMAWDAATITANNQLRDLVKEFAMQIIKDIRDENRLYQLGPPTG